jgi:hypothetical protein
MTTPLTTLPVASQATLDWFYRLLQDKADSFVAQVTGDGTTSRFDLPVERVDSNTFQAYNPGPPVVFINPTAYTLESKSGVLTLGTPLALNAVLGVTGYFYRYFTPDEADAFINMAFLMHTAGEVKTIRTVSTTTGFTTYAATPVDWSTIQPVEYYLVAMLAVIEALWALANDVSTDIDISTPEGVSIPRTQRYQQITAQIERLNMEYERLCVLMGVGLYRIQMFNLRRVSRSTNRLIPEYVEREFDDYTYPPQRIYPTIDPTG